MKKDWSLKDQHTWQINIQSRLFSGILNKMSNISSFLSNIFDISAKEMYYDLARDRKKLHPKEVMT